MAMTAPSVAYLVEQPALRRRPRRGPAPRLCTDVKAIQTPSSISYTENYEWNILSGVCMT
jgi:hypothetical protein